MKIYRSRFCWRVACAAMLFTAAICSFSKAAESSAKNVADDFADNFAVEQGDVKLTAKVDKTSVRVAEPFALTLQMKAPRGTRVKFPPTSKRLGDFDVVSSTDVFDIPDGELRLWTRVLQLESIESGEIVIPGIEIQTAAADAADFQPITSPAIPIQIVSVLEGRENPTEFRDIKNVVDMPVPAEPSYAWIWWTLGGGGLLAIATVAVVILRRRRELSPDQRALADLDALANSDLLAQGEFDVFYTTLVDILRIYIEQRFSIAATRQTTREFLEKVRDDARLAGDVKSQLDAILKVADQVKFGRFAPGNTQMQTATDHARQFVRQTSATAKSSPKREAA